MHASLISLRAAGPVDKRGDMSSERPTPTELLEKLKGVPYPGFTRDIVSFGVVRDVEVSSTGVTVKLAPSTANEEVVQQIEAAVQAALAPVSGGGAVTIVREKSPAPSAARRGPEPIPGVRRILAVASGKGGVGKSTVATNLALALSALGSRVGLMDADVYGPSIPLMLGITEKARSGEGQRLQPTLRHGLAVISMGMFVGEGTPIIWRGPMITKLITEFLRNCDWGDLDVLVMDLPPGTGDVQLTLTQQVPITGGVIVTTPQDVALADVRRGIQMFRQMHAPVLGVIENMSYHLCPGCGARAELFGHGGGAAMARELGVPFLGEVPLDRALREAADQGLPLVAAAPSSPQSRAFHEIAERVLIRLEDAERPPPATPFNVPS
jgi:ATP-binding protein involved in chromosome partitioning